MDVVPSLIVTDIGVKRFCYCPRWYYIHYVLGFRPRTPVKAKFVIGDALMACLGTNSTDSFLERCEDLSRSEEMTEEDVDAQEMFARGKLLGEELLKWRAGIGQVAWQEQLIKYELNGVMLEAYPKIVATRNGKLILFHFRTAYEATKPMDLLGFYYSALIQQKGLEASNVFLKDIALVSAIVRTRKDRYSSRAKTALVEIKEDELYIPEFFSKQLVSIIEQIKSCSASNNFPGLGVIDGACIWCPNGRVIRGQMLCEQPDETLKALADSSLQRASMERWRDEF